MEKVSKISKSVPSKSLSSNNSKEKPTGRELSIGSGERQRIEEREKELDPTPSDTIASNEVEGSRFRVELDVSQIRFDALNENQNREPIADPIDLSNNPWSLLEEECEVDEHELEQYAAKWDRLFSGSGSKELTLREILEELEVEGFARQDESVEKQSVEKEKKLDSNKHESRNARRNRLRKEARQQSVNAKEAQVTSQNSTCSREGARYAKQSARIVGAFATFIDRLSYGLKWLEKLPKDQDVLELQVALRAIMVQLKEKQAEYQRLRIEVRCSCAKEEIVNGMQKNDEVINWFYAMRSSWTEVAECLVTKLTGESGVGKVHFLFGDSKKNIARLPNKSSLAPANVKKALFHLLELKATLDERLIQRIKEETGVRDVFAMLPEGPMQLHAVAEANEELERLANLVEQLGTIEIRNRPRSKGIMESRSLYVKLKDVIDLARGYLDVTLVNSKVRVFRSQYLLAQIKKSDKGAI